MQAWLNKSVKIAVVLVFFLLEAQGVEKGFERFENLCKSVLFILWGLNVYYYRGNQEGLLTCFIVQQSNRLPF